MRSKNKNERDEKKGGERKYSAGRWQIIVSPGYTFAARSLLIISLLRVHSRDPTWTTFVKLVLVDFSSPPGYARAKQKLLCNKRETCFRVARDEKRKSDSRTRWYRRRSDLRFLRWSVQFCIFFFYGLIIICNVRLDLNIGEMYWNCFYRDFLCSHDTPLKMILDCWDLQ